MENTLIDLTYLRNFCDNDDAFVQEMIQTFLEKIPEEIHDLQTAMSEKNWDNAYQAVHSLKSSLYFIGLHDMTKDMAKLESNFSQKIRIEESKPAIAIMIAKTQEALKELQQMLQ